MMTGLLKTPVKALPHPVFMRIYHAWYLRTEVSKLHRASKLAGAPVLDRLDLRHLKGSDCVFILGSGPSINEISDACWSYITQHDTLGFNWWPLHRVVPKMYVFESIETNCELFPYFMRMFEQRAHDYRHTVKIVSNVEDSDLKGQLLYAAPEEFKLNMYVGLGVPVIARNVEELRRGLRFIRKKGGFAPGSSARWLFKYGGSVTAMISLALCMGYKRIVLCGVDLGLQEYFYQNPKFYPESAHWEFAPRGQPHLTTRRLEYLVPAQEVIWTMDEEILRPMEVELLVLSKTSTLYPRVPAVQLSRCSSLS
jgi:hypothetical protein